jgi:hypothetical protein
LPFETSTCPLNCLLKPSSHAATLIPKLAVAMKRELGRRDTWIAQPHRDGQGHDADQTFEVGATGPAVTVVLHQNGQHPRAPRIVR